VLGKLCVKKHTERTRAHRDGWSFRSQNPGAGSQELNAGVRIQEPGVKCSSQNPEAGTNDRDSFFLTAVDAGSRWSTEEKFTALG